MARLKNRYGPRYPQCIYCGEGPLKWVEGPLGWRLRHASGRVHNCHEYTKAKKIFTGEVNNAN